MRKYTFNKETRYITSGISECIPIEVQFYMWAEINKLIKQDAKLDYLQIFDFKVENVFLIIKHKQEKPHYEKTHTIKLREINMELDKLKVYIIDDITHSTMLLSSEY